MDVPPARAGRASSMRSPISSGRTAVAYADSEVGKSRDRERYHRRVAERRVVGLCVKCGRCQPAPGRPICDACAEKARAASSRCGKAQTGPRPRPGVRTRALPPTGRSASRSRPMRPMRNRSGSGRPLVLRALSGEEARGRPHSIPRGQECRAQVRRQIGSGQAQGRPHRQQAAPGDPPRFGGMYRLRTPSARRGRRDLRALPHRATRGGPRTLRRPAVRRVVREMFSPDERRRLPVITVFSARIRGPFRRTKE